MTGESFKCDTPSPTDKDVYTPWKSPLRGRFHYCTFMRVEEVFIPLDYTLTTEYRRDSFAGENVHFIFRRHQGLTGDYGMQP